MGQWKRLKGNEKYLKLNENENVSCQNLSYATKVALKGKFIEWNAYNRSI